MKHIFTKLILLLLVFAMVIPFAASCSKNYGNPDPNLQINISALNGTTALGMAKMINDSATDNMNYNISLHPSADTVTAPIVSGECAIAALPTNVAVRLFNKSQGKVQLLSLNTLGVLYLIQGEGESITALDQLRGKTVYVPGAGANPEYITAALLTKAGLKVGEDVTIDATSYSSPDALVAAVAKGNAKLAVLPEPKVSATISQNQTISVALDLTKEWENQYGKNTLVQGCLVVNTEFAKAHPAEIAQFLKDYKASVEFIKAGSDEAVNMIVSANILPKAAIAKKALPNCNLCYFAGEDMKTVMNAFCSAIYSYDTASITKMPTDDFYYISPVK
jgi:NitT/TauT family transport system substrate-binding protein